MAAMKNTLKDWATVAAELARLRQKLDTVQDEKLAEIHRLRKGSPWEKASVEFWIYEATP